MKNYKEYFIRASIKKKLKCTDWLCAQDIKLIQNKQDNNNFEQAKFKLAFLFHEEIFHQGFTKKVGTTWPSLGTPAWTSG